MIDTIYIAQVRVKAHTSEPDAWRTVEFGRWEGKGREAFRSQVAPVWRKRGYETRIIRDQVEFQA